MTADPRGLGPLGRRLLAAFVLVALTSVAVLTVAALIGTSRGLAAGEEAARQEAAREVADLAAEAYGTAGGWAGADLVAADRAAGDAGARLTIRAADGTVVRSPAGESGGGPAGPGRGAVTADVVVTGTVVGTVRLGFGNPATSTAQRIAWTWILVAAGAALVVAAVAAWFVSRRISRPLRRLADVAHAFAAGDRTARPGAAELAAPGEIGALASAFDTTADAVMRSDDTRRRMAADVAHELRTPLAALQAGLEEVRDGFVPADEQRLAALHAQAVRLGRVVDDLAELSGAESARLSMRHDVVDVGRLVADAVGAATPSLEDAGLRIDVALAADVLVIGDPDRLHQAVGNLLSNAARYCRVGDDVRITVAADGSRAVVVVADTGPGIAPDDLPHVFDRLWRGNADVDRGGSGIGLAVVRELVTAHGGSVSATSDGVAGSCFTLRLPLASGVTAPTPPAAHQSTPAEQAPRG